MLVVDPERRLTIEQCLSHPWLTQGAAGVNDSTGGLVKAITDLEVTRRAPVRERTLLAALNTVEVTAHLNAGKDHPSPVKVFSKNKHRVTNASKEQGPAHQRAPQEFVEMGGKGDQQLFEDDGNSNYPEGDAVLKVKGRGKTNGR